MEEARGAAGARGRVPALPGAIRSGVETPVKSTVAPGIHSFVPKGLALGFPPARRPSPAGSQERHLLPQSLGLARDVSTHPEGVGLGSYQVQRTLCLLPSSVWGLRGDSVIQINSTGGKGLKLFP